MLSNILTKLAGRVMTWKQKRLESIESFDVCPTCGNSWAIHDGDGYCGDDIETEERVNRKLQAKMGQKDSI